MTSGFICGEPNPKNLFSSSSDADQYDAQRVQWQFVLQSFACSAGDISHTLPQSCCRAIQPENLQAPQTCHASRPHLLSLRIWWNPCCAVEQWPCAPSLVVSQPVSNHHWPALPSAFWSTLPGDLQCDTRLQELSQGQFESIWSKGHDHFANMMVDQDYIMMTHIKLRRLWQIIYCAFLFET